MKTIFVVDDNNANLIVADKALSEHYNVFTLPSAEAMFEFLECVRPDLILLDIKMPKTDGLEALIMLKSEAKYENIPVVFLTGKRDPDTEVLGFELGAIDYISKPFSPRALLSRINTHLNIEGLIRERTAMLLERTVNLQRVKRGTVSVLANIVENRDSLTGRHIERTSKYVKKLIEAMLERGIYAEELDGWDIDAIAESSFLHDIGKITVSDLILNKKGRLTDEEFEVIKTHTTAGEIIIDGIMEKTGDESFLQNAKIFAGHHHEKWNGKGYPRGLKGMEISLQGRIMAVADVYDALVTVRPYKDAIPHREAVKIIRESSGSHFDPNIVDVFLEISDSLNEIVKKGETAL